MGFLGFWLSYLSALQGALSHRCVVPTYFLFLSLNIPGLWSNRFECMKMLKLLVTTADDRQNSSQWRRETSGNMSEMEREREKKIKLRRAIYQLTERKFQTNSSSPMKKINS